MTYDDTHATPAQLPGLDPWAFDMAVVKDETTAPMRHLFSSPPPGKPYQAGRNHWRRLVVHVSDINTPGLDALLLKTLGVELWNVPF